MEYVQTKDIAIEVRKQLKAFFPDIKFSVTSKRDTINIDYVDGPIADDVSPVAEKYNGYSDYDPIYCDYKKHNEVMFQGVMQKTSLMYINVNRTFSREFLNEVLDFMESEFGEPLFEVQILTRADGTAYFECDDFDTLSVYGELSRRCDANSLVIVQEEAYAEANDENYQAWKIRAITVIFDSEKEELKEQWSLSGV